MNELMNESKTWQVNKEITSLAVTMLTNYEIFSMQLGMLFWTYNEWCQYHYADPLYTMLVELENDRVFFLWKFLKL